ncbi:lipopolysaccharide biosynthesis protein [Thalassotalea sp. ND16A]|uniref:lipopolysaccharide biosynthesis protein n=1 Tax=Thalassotalea sp. ND16A TaxID=1535422 RepID=UPI00051A7A1C|nr:lipopolysaccharide biosynthesis protein [Thalassotalea sp. ND16A]KGJ95950.1 hypothetical protein ND16A_1129 [Thalassotalea sp. ND16A]
MLDIKSRVVSGVKWSLSAKLFAQIFSWVVTFTIIRILTPEDYGIIEISTAMIGLAVALGVSGLSDVLVQKKEQDDKLYSQVLTLAFTVNILLVLILLLTADLIANWFAIPQLENIIKVLSFNVFLISFTIVPEGILKREMNFKRLSLIQLVKAVTNSVTSLILALNGFGLWSIILGNLASTLILVLLLNLSVKSKYFFTMDFSDFYYYFNFGLFTMVNSLLTFIFLKADALIIGKLLGSESLGYYSVGSQLANLPLEKVAQTLNEVSYVGYANVKENPRHVAYYYLQSSKIIAFLAFPVFWGLASVAQPLVEVLLGEKWADATVIIQVLAVVMPFRIYQLATQSAIAGIGHPKFNSKNLAVLCVVIPPSVLIGLNWGILGAAVGWSLSYFIFYIWMLRRSFKFLDINPLDYLKSIAAPMISGAAMFLVNFVLMDNTFYDNSIWDLCSLIIIGALVYFAFIFLFDKTIISRFKQLLVNDAYL